MEEKIPEWAHIKSKAGPRKQPKLINYDKAKWIKYFGTGNSDLMMTDVGTYSIAKPSIKNNLVSLIDKMTSPGGKKIITETHAGLGGFTLELLKHADLVQAVEIEKLHADIIFNNANILVPEYISKLKLINGDYANYMDKFAQNIIICDPPWGGFNYKKNESMDLGLNNTNIIHVINKLYGKFDLFILLAPYNFNFNKLYMHIRPKFVDKISVHHADETHKHFFVCIKA